MADWYVSPAAPANWAANTAYQNGAGVTPTVSNGHWYQVVRAGTSHASVQPTWPTDGTQITDGTVIWADNGLLQPAGDDGNPGDDWGTGHAFATIATAIAAASSNDTIHVDYGYHDTGNLAVIYPGQVNVTGRGTIAPTQLGQQNIPYLVNTLQSTDAFFVPGTKGVYRYFAIVSLVTSKVQTTPVGGATPDQDGNEFTNVVFDSCFIFGSNDCVLISLTGSNIVLRNCALESNFDVVQCQNGSTITLIGCTIKIYSPPLGQSVTTQNTQRGITSTSGQVTAIGCRIYVTSLEATATCYGVFAGPSGLCLCEGCTFILNAPNSPSVFLSVGGSGTVIMLACSYDQTKVSSGALRYFLNSSGGAITPFLVAGGSAGPFVMTKDPNSGLLALGPFPVVP